jgi:hypothetical protein
MRLPASLLPSPICSKQIPIPRAVCYSAADQHLQEWKTSGKAEEMRLLFLDFVNAKAATRQEYGNAA